MLVLSRRIGEKVVIDGRITLEVIGIERGRIKLGIIAPRNVPVFRKELDDKRKNAEPA